LGEGLIRVDETKTAAGRRSILIVLAAFCAAAVTAATTEGPLDRLAGRTGHRPADRARRRRARLL
jgi:hypothetical protein